MNDHIITMRLSVQVGLGKWMEMEMQLDRTLFNDAFSPLPRGREIPWDFAARKFAEEQMKSRREAQNHLSVVLKEMLEKIMAHSDTINGYTKEEWDKIK